MWAALEHTLRLMAGYFSTEITDGDSYRMMLGEAAQSQHFKSRRMDGEQPCYLKVLCFIWLKDVISVMLFTFAGDDTSSRPLLE